MPGWTGDELKNIAESDELQISWLKADGTLHSPVTIWVVRLDDDLYLRSVRGPGSIWFRGTQLRHAGRIEAGGVTKDVAFVEDVAADVHKRIDAAYRAKYSGYAANIVNSVLTPAARSATIKLVPR